MVLTSRDQELFFKLQSYGLLTTKQIEFLVFKNVALTTVLRRLRALESTGYIKRASRLAAGETVWALTQKGGQKIHASVIRSYFRSDTLDHDLRLIGLRIQLEGLGIAKSWIPEHEIRSRAAKKWGVKWMKQKIVADGVMGTTIDELQESIAIELELTWKNSGRYRKVCDEYRMKDSLWGTWYIVGTMSLGKSIEKVWKETPNWFPAYNFLWSLEEEILTLGLNARVFWRGKILKLGDLFEVKMPTLAGTTPAHGVSSPKDKDTLVRLGTSIEDDKEKLAPAS